MIPTIKVNESPDQHFIRVCIAKRDGDISESWQEIKEIFGYQYGADQLRKSADGMVQYQLAYSKPQVSFEELSTQLDKKMENLAKAQTRIQLDRQMVNVQKVGLNKDIREDARTQLQWDAIKEAIMSQTIPTPPKAIARTGKSSREYILTLADTHYGRKVTIKGFEGETVAEYSVDIFEKRMESLYNHTLNLINRLGIKHIHIVNLSDSIDGILRVSQISSLEKGIFDSAIDYAKYMVQWLNQLSAHVTLEYHSVQGNHTEIRPLGSQKGDFPHENIERIITQFIDLSLSGNDNIVIHENKPFAYLDLFGTKVLATHGQNESRDLEKMVKEYIVMYNKPVNMLLTGHLHFLHNKVIGFAGDKSIEFVQSPSICGTDDYAANLKKGTLAGALLIEFEEKQGKTAIFDITL